MKRFIPIMLLTLTVLYAATPEGTSVIGKINDKAYTYAEYNDILTKYFAYYSEKQGKTLTDEDKAGLNDQCWEELVGRYVYDQAIKAGVISVSDKELLEEAKKNPPPSVKNIDDLWVNGKFQQKDYEDALQNAPQFRSAVLDDVRWNYQYKKLVEHLKGPATADEDSVRMQWEREREVVDAQIIVFDAGKLTSVNCTEEEARQYYQERREDYRKDNCRKLHYVRFAKVGTSADTLAVKERIDQMYTELLGGADFAQMAREHSQDSGSSQSGGDLGWFGKGKMVQVFEETAFNTPVGQISQPVSSRFGWHIIQTLDRRTTPTGDEVNARHILLRVDPSETTQQKMKTGSAMLYTRAKEIGLVQAAAELGFTLEETPAFQEKDGFIRGIGREAKLITFAFNNPEGTLADILHTPSGDIYICAVSAILPVYYTPFEDDSAKITNNATRSKRGYYMNEYVHNFVRNITPDKYLDWARKDSIMVLDITGHKKGDSITSLGKVDALENALFTYPVGTFGELVSEPSRWFLIKVQKHVIPEQAQWEVERQDALQKAKDSARTKRLNDWYAQERKKVSIIDNRRDFYDLSASRKMRQIKL